MKSATLQRTTFETSRLLEFFTEKELQMQMGCGPDLWPLALVKELIDNALDACESAGIDPAINVIIEEDAVTVEDNGPGLPDGTLEQSLDYAVRVSDKSHYVSPTRGQLGNALKCLWAAPFVMDGVRGRVEIATRGRVHHVEVTLDRIGQRPRVRHLVDDDDPVRTGTSVKVFWEGIASYLDNDDGAYSYKLSRDYLAFNPHLTLGEFEAANTSWTKWTPDAPTSPHWYTPERLRGLIAAYVNIERAGGKGRTVRDFVSEFAGLAGTKKQKAVTDAAGLSGALLRGLVDGDDIDLGSASRLLQEMQAQSRPIKPARLGIIGKDHLVAHLRDHRYVDAGSVRYAKQDGVVDGVPFILEVALGVNIDDYRDCGREEIVGLNWSPTLRIPMDELHDHLAESRIDDFDPVAVVVHLACPRLEFTGRGKGTLDLPGPIVEALGCCVRSVAKGWKKAKRKTGRDDRVRQRELERLRKAEQVRPLSIKEAAYHVMEEAYFEASGNGTLPAGGRQVMYAARRKILRSMDVEIWKNDQYFTQKLLPDFVEEHPELTGDWDVVFDDRGHLIEPHTKKVVGLGTLSVRDYINTWGDGSVRSVGTFTLPRDVQTNGPALRYQNVLFVEKEGFFPLLQAAQIAERHDLALMSTKGMSVTAARQLVERLSECGVTILVVRDFDKSGFSIARTLYTNTRRFKFKTRPNVVDLGLRLDDVQRLGLDSEPVEYRGTKDPRENLRANGATEAECEFLVRGREYEGLGAWHGERVELNAMTSPQFIQWLEDKLRDNGVGKVQPDSKILAQAFRRAVRIRLAQEALDQVDALADEEITVPTDLDAKVRQYLSSHPTLTWDQAVARLAET